MGKVEKLLEFARDNGGQFILSTSIIKYVPPVTFTDKLEMTLNRAWMGEEDKLLRDKLMHSI